MDMDNHTWNALDIVIGCFFPFIIGAAIRYATRKWNRPLLATGCLIFVLIAIRVTLDIIRHASIWTFKIEAIVFACLLLGALMADFIYRISGKKTR